MTDTPEASKVALLARSWRGPVVEAEHYGLVAAADTQGRLLAAQGDPQAPVVLRSSAKPLQALAVVTSGARERFDLQPRHLAVCCGSHSGSADHQGVVREILARLGLPESALACGTHWPDDPLESRRLYREGLHPTPLHNNCSGKHAGMLAVARALEASPDGYLDPHHPVQALVRSHLARMTGVPPEALVPLLDGCGAPTYALPLAAVATGFARLAAPQSLPPDLREAAVEVAAAMVAYPELVQAEGGFNTELLRAGAGRVVAKGGAEGLFALGLADRGLGLAIKVSDGSGRPWPPVVCALLRATPEGCPSELEPFARPRQTNCHGAVVGYLEAAPQLRRLPLSSAPQEDSA